MSFDEVETAVRELEAEGTPVSVRSIIAKIGGSSRDIARHLRLLRDPDLVEARRAIEATLAEQRAHIEQLVQEIQHREGPRIQALIDQVQRNTSWAVPLPGIRRGPKAPEPTTTLAAIRRMVHTHLCDNDPLDAWRCARFLATATNRLDAWHVWTAVHDEAGLTVEERQHLVAYIAELRHGVSLADGAAATTAKQFWQREVLAKAQPSASERKAWATAQLQRAHKRERGEI